MATSRKRKREHTHWVQQKTPEERAAEALEVALNVYQWMRKAPPKALVIRLVANLACFLQKHGIALEEVLEESEKLLSTQRQQRRMVAHETATACPHGNHPSECDDCDRAGDFAADVTREARGFGRT